MRGFLILAVVAAILISVKASPLEIGKVQVPETLDESFGKIAEAKEFADLGEGNIMLNISNYLLKF